MLTDISLEEDSDTPPHKDMTLPYGQDQQVIPIDHQGPPTSLHMVWKEQQGQTQQPHQVASSRSTREWKSANLEDYIAHEDTIDSSKMTSSSSRNQLVISTLMKLVKAIG